MSFDLHQIFQDLMKEKAHVMSGYHLIGGEQESRTHIQVDFFCTIDPDRPYAGPEVGIRPLEDFSRYNVIELEGLGRTLSDRRFRYHVGRTLVMENADGHPERRGQTSLTIVAVHKPVKLLGDGQYPFVEIAPWKYRAVVMRDLTVTIIVLRELQKVKGGEPAAWLQVLEPDPRRRFGAWAHILEQELTGRDRLKSIMMKIDEEVFMTVAEEFRVEGRVEGMRKGRVEGMRKGREEGMRKGRVEGMRKGRVEGMRKGREEGLVEGKLAMIRNLIRAGCELSLIVEASGFSREQVAKIKEDLDREI